MPSTALLATTTHEVVLKPAVRRQLLKELRLWAELHAQEKAIKLAKSKHAHAVESMQTELGESSIDLEGFKSTIVAPMRSSLDKKKFVALGGKLEILEKATVQVPGKSYLKITAPGAGKDEDND